MELFQSYKALESNKLSEAKTQNLNQSFKFHSIEWQISTIVEKINNIENLDSVEIKNIINRQHQMILNWDLFLSSDTNRQYLQKIFTNKRFLEIFLEEIGLISLSDHEIICINKLAYDYYTMPQKDDQIAELLLQISYRINNPLVIKLSAILGMNGGRILSMIANSSFKVEKNVHRVNTFIMKCNIALSTQDIVNIYCIIFSSFKYPFIYAMLEAKPNNLTPEQNQRFDAISVAILSILDSMTSQDIQAILYDYAFMLKMVKPGTPVRFALKSVASYTRIQNIISNIEQDPIDNLQIP